MSGRIETTERELVEWEGDRAAVVLKRADVAILTLTRGSSAERPFIQGTIGGAAVCGASVLLVRVAQHGAVGAPMTKAWLAIAACALVLHVLGAALVWAALSRRDFVLATLRDGTQRKVLLPRKWSAAERSALVTRLRSLGWVLDGQLRGDPIPMTPLRPE